MSLRSSQWFRRAAIAITALAFLLLAVRAAQHVVNGEAADTFTNVKGMHISWGTALAFLVALSTVPLVAVVARWWQLRGGWIRFARFSRPQISKVDEGAESPSTDTPSNTSLERTRER